MPKKKDHQSTEDSEEEVLNKRVDAIMDPNAPDPSSQKTRAAPAIDIFKDAPAEVAQATKTAPEVSGELLKDVDKDVIESQQSSLSKPKKVNPGLKNEKGSKTNTVHIKPVAPPESPTKINPPESKTIDLDDRATAEAVKDIASKESDTILALQDAIGRKASHLAGDLAEGDKRAARRKRRVLLMLLAIAVLLFLLAVPHISYTCHWSIGIRLRFTTDILPSVCK